MFRIFKFKRRERFGGLLLFVDDTIMRSPVLTQLVFVLPCQLMQIAPVLLKKKMCIEYYINMDQIYLLYKLIVLY